ncbi:YqiA/YcfP family alpha/beta fold hydrolase [Acinetobacter portensis]|uniref:YqiA/YcfP family alpha/beta fold hydrolase n=1 Tax=Acinetobacter portensis TaxID=1839785 RepID=UPI0013D6008A|nr:YqiA/YcfP family alpha/beta fold hydrolase [Acinetobacter portensis]
MNLIYLHGFQSAPMSMKGQWLKDYVEQQHNIKIHLPDLNMPPLDVMRDMENLIKKLDHVALVGSSLGGFYATQLVAKFAVPAVLINPAMRPWQLFKDLFGDEQIPYKVCDTWTLDHAQLNDLEQLAVPFVQDADKIMVLLQQGDEVLDYREAERYYKRSLLISESNGNHAMDDFKTKIPMALRFLSDSIK